MGMVSGSGSKYLKSKCKQNDMKALIMVLWFLLVDGLNAWVAVCAACCRSSAK
jgi:hypothetical protein